MSENLVWRLRRSLAKTPLAPILILPSRAATVIRYQAQLALASGLWLIQSKEHTNFTYDITERNKVYLIWFVANLTGRPFEEIQSYVSEIENDQTLKSALLGALENSRRRYLMDTRILFGRRLAWYALVRATKPEVVVETGTDRGLGSAVIASALLRNGNGHLFTMDINPDAGSLFSATYLENVVTRMTGNSIDLINDLGAGIDLFIHDSNHDPAYEAQEIGAAARRSSPSAWLLSDNSEASSVLAEWAQLNGRLFAFFREEPRNHWWPGGGVGAAWIPAG